MIYMYHDMGDTEERKCLYHNPTQLKKITSTPKQNQLFLFFCYNVENRKSMKT